MKTNLYESGIRVPFVARWSGRIPAGKTETRPWASYDLLPTLGEFAGIKQDVPGDGVSFAPLLTGGRQEKAHEFLYFEYPEGPQQQAVLANGLKLVRPDLKSRPDKVELYDLAADPAEKTDLASTRMQDVERLLAIAKREHEPSGAFPIESLDPKPVPRGYSIPFIDLSDDVSRQTVVDKESGQYLGHVSTVLLDDGKTILAAYPKGHGRGAIVLRRSFDGGKTWSERLPVPENWATSLETPTIHRVVDPKTRRKRLILWSGLYPARLASSDDDGKRWTPLKQVGDWGGIVVMGSVERLKDGRYLAMFHDDGRFYRKDGKASEAMSLYKTFSGDGGLTWSEPEVIYSSSDVHLCEPGVVRSPDGKRLAALLRENRRKRNSFVIFSDDEGRSWSAPKELPGALTGDRHTARYASDGRLVVSFRDMAHESATRGDWVAWVGKFEDLENGREGQYRVRLMDNLSGTDCGYPGVEVLGDGTFVCTTYGHWSAGEQPYIVSVRFRLQEIDLRLR